MAASNGFKGTVAGLVVAGAAVLATISGFEGTEYVPYKDVGGVWTACQGDTYDIDPNKVYSPEECAARLKKQVTKHSEEILACIKVGVSQNEFDAYTSMAYNIGSGAFCSSTLVRKLNAGDHEGACAEIKRWNKVQGRVWAGLTKRREAEYRLCMKGLPV